MHYVSYEQVVHSIFIETPVALITSPEIKTSDSKAFAYQSVEQLSSANANLMFLEIELSYVCPEKNFYGMVFVNMTLAFEGCPTYVVTWQKSCGKDAIRKFKC